MRLFLRSLLVLTLILAAVPIVQASTPVNAPEAATDDELVILSSDGRIVVRDPYTPPGIRPVAWESPGTGFSDVVAGDFNGDTSAEIVGLRGVEAIVFSPVVLPGSTDIGRTFNATSGQTWKQALTGDFDGDGRDELVLVQTTNQPNLAIQMFAYQWRPTTGWTQTFTGGYGAPWKAISAGDVDGDGKDEFVAVRNSNFTYQIIILKPSNNWQTLFSQNYTFPWITVEVGNTQADAGNREEIVVTRGDVLGTFPSLYIFRYTGNPTALETLQGANYYPYFDDVALGDVNNSGVDTVYLLRPGVFNGQPVVALTNRYFGPGSVTQFNELANQTRFKTIHTGDLDADTRAELVVMASDTYYIYNDPGASTTNFSQNPGSYSSTTNFAVANVDGPGIPTGPSLNVSPTTINWNLQAGTSTSQQVQITNAGGAGTLNWTASVTEGGSWLSINPSSGTAPSTMLVSANTSNLVGGTYTGKVRVTGTGSVFNSPVDITVTLTVTAPQFSVRPPNVSWYYRQGSNPSPRIVEVVGPSINWHAGAVPTSMVPLIEEAIANGTPLRFDNGRLMIGDQPAPEDVPIVDWIDINPSVGTATQSGTTVQLTLVTSQVDYGFTSAAVVFVADQVASPPAVVVRVSLLTSLADQSDLTFMPSVQ